MPINHAILNEHLRALSNRHAVSVSDDGGWLVVHEFNLPPGYNATHTAILIQVPDDYPLKPPGVGCRVYVTPDLRFKGQVLPSYYVHEVPDWGRWGWLCYKGIRWNPHVDNLITFLDMLRTDLTNPRTKKPEKAA